MKTFKKDEPLVFQIHSATVKGTFISENTDTITVKITEDFTGEVGKERSVRKEFLVNNN